MKLAAEEALKARGMTQTNPLVGAVIVKKDQVLATGYHHQFGGVHAEVDALNNLADLRLAQGATLYVTLEPCSHYGKQPPCSYQIAAAGIKQVIIGQVDPHQIVSGKGISYLEAHGVKTKLLGQTEFLNEAYNFFYQRQRPLVTLKYAMSVDGKLNEEQEKRTFITGQAAQLDTQVLRLDQQAILIGANTLRIDNPALTVRIKKLPVPPVRIVLTHDANCLDFNKKLFNLPGRIWLLSNVALTKSVRENVTCFVDQEWTPAKIMRLLAEKEIQSLLIEGGSNLQAQFMAAKLVDKIVAYVAPVILGGTAMPVAMGPRLERPLHYQLVDLRTCGEDVRICLRRE